MHPDFNQQGGYSDDLKSRHLWHGYWFLVSLIRNLHKFDFLKLKSIREPVSHIIHSF